MTEKELIIPAYITEKYIEDILRKSENDSKLKVSSYRVDHGCKPGDHFCSLMLKVMVNYTTGHGTTITDRSLIVKTDNYDGDVQADLLSDIALFDPEIRVYSKTLPAMERILKSAGIEEIFWPKLIHYSQKPPVLVLEDIRQENFSMIYHGVSFNDLQPVIENIAKYHALSLVVHEEDPSLVDYTNSMIHVDNREMLTTLMRGLDILTEQTKEWPGFETVYEKMKNNRGKFLDNLFSVYERDRGGWGYNVLNHGDFHIRNMMFKRVGDKIEKVKFLDYQMPHWGSPALDLSYLIHINGNEEVEDRREEVYQKYYNCFKENLLRFGYLKPIPTLLDLKLEILRCGAIEVMHTLGFLPLFMLDVETVKFNEVYDRNTDHMLVVTRPIYESPEVIALMKKNLMDLLYRGLLD